MLLIKGASNTIKFSAFIVEAKLFLGETFVLEIIKLHEMCLGWGMKSKA